MDGLRSWDVRSVYIYTHRRVGKARRSSAAPARRRAEYKKAPSPPPFSLSLSLRAPPPSQMSPRPGLIFHESFPASFLLRPLVSRPLIIRARAYTLFLPFSTSHIPFKKEATSDVMPCAGRRRCHRRGISCSLLLPSWLLSARPRGGSLDFILSWPARNELRFSYSHPPYTCAATRTLFRLPLWWRLVFWPRAFCLWIIGLCEAIFVVRILVNEDKIRRTITYWLFSIDYWLNMYYSTICE